MGVKKNEFTPVDLNEETVQTIFNNCLARTTSQNVIGIHLFSKHYGFEKDSDPILFDKEKLDIAKFQIDFLFGQLKCIREGNLHIGPFDAQIKYTNEVWTKENRILIQFLHLGCASRALAPFYASDKKADLLAFVPTISPKDPRFTEWFENVYKPGIKMSCGLELSND